MNLKSSLKSKLESKVICDNCVLNTYITYDDKNYILEIDYQNGKFVAEKQFPNNYIGVANMEEIKNQYTNEKDVRTYFGLF